MKRLNKRFLCSSILLLATSSFASSPTPDANTDVLKAIKKYVYNMGKYFGNDLENEPQPPINNNLSQATTQAITSALFPAFQSLWGAIPVSTIGLIKESPDNSVFVPKGTDTYSILNIANNSTFDTSAYAGNSTGTISASPLIDQTQDNGSAYRDPVSQSVANMLTTPDDSYCLQGDTVLCKNKSITDGGITQNIIGNIPFFSQFYTSTYNQNVIPQLNSNSLLAPLMYSSEAFSNNGDKSVNTSAGQLSNSTQQGPLKAESQAQQAQNFIRYAAGAATLISIPNKDLYRQLYDATQKSTGLQRWSASATLTKYLVSLRVYAAQVSVAVGNMYYILSKRMTQPIIQGNNKEASTNTSQALSEYKMATWRLFNPSPKEGESGHKGANTEWLDNLNQASSTSIQKEIAVLLAEINYQMYLNRQQEERLLLTNSMLLLQSSQNLKPAADALTQSTGQTDSSQAQGQ